MIKLAMVGLDVSSGSFGGVYNYIKLFLKHVDRKEVDVNYYSLGKSPNWYEGEDQPNRIEFLVKSFIRIIFFNKFLNDNDIEIVHLNSGLTQGSLFREGLISILSKLAGRKTLFFIHGWKEKEFQKIKKNSLKKKFFFSILKKQEIIVVLSSSFKDKLVEEGIDEEKIKVSSTMVESENYLPDEKDYEAHFDVLFCSRLVKKKGPYELLEAAKNVLKDYPGTKFIFMGKGEEYKGLLEQSQKLGIEDNVDFLGFKTGEEKFQIYKNSHIFVLPSYTEGLPNVALEAMASGLVLITTPVGGLKDLIEVGKNGFFIKSVPPEPEEIKDELEKVLDDERLIERISINNLEEAKNVYDVNAVTGDIVDLYHKIKGE